MALLVASVTACGAGASKVSGKTYAFDSYTQDGEDMTADFASMYKEQTLAFTDDGVCVQTIEWADEAATMLGISEPMEVSGTYTESGDTLSVVFPDEEGDTVMEFVIGEDTLTMTEDGAVTVYTLK